jgi:hypothetical protein
MTTRIRFQVVSVAEMGVPKSVERIRLGMLIGGSKLVNVQVGDINISLEETEKDVWGRFKLGDIYTVDFNKDEGGK